MIPGEEAYVDIGGGVEYRFCFGHEDNEEPGNIVGLIERHRRPDGEYCTGSIIFAPRPAWLGPGPSWEIVQQEPLTLTPSILCRRCGNHGYIRNGKWEKV